MLQALSLKNKFQQLFSKTYVRVEEFEEIIVGKFWFFLSLPEICSFPYKILIVLFLFLKASADFLQPGIPFIIRT